MDRLEPRDRLREERGCGLEQRADFDGVAALAVPDVERTDLRQDVRARDQALIEQGAGGSAGVVVTGERAPAQRRFAHRRFPASCAPHAVAAANSAPDSWCSAASQIGTPDITIVFSFFF